MVSKRKETGILRRTERAMIRVMWGAKLMDKKNTKEFMGMLGLSESIEMVANAMLCGGMGMFWEKRKTTSCERHLILNGWMEEEGKTKVYLEKTCEGINLRKLVSKMMMLSILWCGKRCAASKKQ